MTKTKEQPKLRLQINTELKQIKVEGNPNIGELFKGLKLLLPKDSPFGSYEDYTIECNTVISYWNSPIYVPYTQPYQWWTSNPYTITCDTNTDNQGITHTSASTTNCIYNLELK